MRIKTFASVFALFVLSLAAPALINAQTASGTYQFTFEDRYVKSLQFDASGDGRGGASGEMYFSDEATVTYMDLDGDGTKETSYPGFYVKANFDGMEVKNNQAVMSGTVFDSSIRDLVGMRVLLTVEDNGDNTKVPDKLTWGLYKPIVRNWTPSDAELKDDPGVGLRWWATDAEVRDDVGYEMPRSEAIDHKSFPIATYAFVDVETAAGDILVRP